MFQGEYLSIANVGDSRAVLATTSDNGTLTPIQLTTDLKPNLPSTYTLFIFYKPYIRNCVTQFSISTV
jgi:serine/threonine protein phosphatase PrpC